MTNKPETQPISPEVLAAIEAKEAFIVDFFARNLSVELLPNIESVEYLDGYIERNAPSWQGQTREKIVDMFASFLGQAIIKTYGGEWVETEGAYGIQLSNGAVAFPFAKVSKQMKNGAEDSILSFFKFIPLILDGALDT